MKRAPIRRKRSKAKADAAYERNYGPLAAFVREYRCCVCKSTETFACHVKGKRAYGAWLTCPHTGDRIGNIYPACKTHHDEQHDHGIKTFEAKYGFSLSGLAADLGRAFEEQER